MKTIEQVDTAKLKAACGSLNTWLEDNEIEGAVKIRTTGVKNEKVLEGFVGTIKAIAAADRGNDLPEDVILMSNDVFSAPKTDPTPKKDPKPKKPKEPVPTSRYGHREGSQAAKLDDLLFKGTTIKAAAEACDTKETRVKSHILHLQKKKGLTINEEEGVYKVA
jgi:hypothetical protein